MIKAIIKAPIHIYRIVLSPWLGQNCRFHPTCSTYALEAIDRHGAAKGLILALKRVLKCHPLHRGPFHDPVPKSKEH